MKKMKLPLKILLGALALVLVVIAGYVAYVFAAYYRVEDNQILPVVAMDGADRGELTAGELYRVASYNIGFGAYSNDYSFFMDGGKESRARSPEAVRENVTGAMETVAAIAPQFLLLQEVDIDGTRSWHVNELEQVIDPQSGGLFVNRTFAQNYDSPYLFWPLLEPHGANRAGQVTCSAFPIISALRRQLPIEEGFMKLIDCDRCYSVQRIPLAGGNRELVLYNLHLSAYTSDGTIAEEQLAMLFTDMLAEYNQGNYTIAGGDFNKDLLGNSSEIFGVSGPAYTWAQPIPASLIPEGLAIVAPFDEEKPVASCRNADRPYGPDNYRVTVDGFIVSANIDVRKAQVWETGFRWSDHNPVFMDFILQ
mgnify:FL=1|jgi:endonuclease/exonuclease/phosphatase family metal-dependent hydrolase